MKQSKREIKFRAWDTQTIEMVKHENLAIVAGEGAYIVEQNEGSLVSSFRSGLIVMQYTGLKDKNGVEIYEGDIVAIDWVYDKINFGDSVKRDNLDVEWGDRGWLPFNEPGSIDCAWCYDIDSAEVIGNIYENPELLVEDIHADQLGETLPAALERKKK